MNVNQAKQYHGEASELNPILSTRKNSIKRLNESDLVKDLSLPFLSKPKSLVTTQTLID
jgi:hypothetical protein